MSEDLEVTVDPVLVRDIYVAAVAQAIATKAYEVDYSNVLAAATAAAAAVARVEAKKNAEGMTAWINSLEG